MSEFAHFSSVFRTVGTQSNFTEVKYDKFSIAQSLTVTCSEKSGSTVIRNVLDSKDFINVIAVADKVDVQLLDIKSGNSRRRQ